jgi:hypothetical protein
MKVVRDLTTREKQLAEGVFGQARLKASSIVVLQREQLAHVKARP